MNINKDHTMTHGYNNVVKYGVVVCVILSVIFIGGCLYSSLKESLVESQNIDKFARVIIADYNQRDFNELYSMLSVDYRGERAAFDTHIRDVFEGLGKIDIKNSEPIIHGTERGVDYISRVYNLTGQSKNGAMRVWMTNDSEYRLVNFVIRY